MNAAVLLHQLRQAGICLRARGDKLVVEAPEGALTDELRATLRAHKAEILALLGAAQVASLDQRVEAALAELDPEVAWRVRAFWPQIPPRPAPLPTFTARPPAAWPPVAPGALACNSCGEPVGEGYLYRCRACVEAARFCYRWLRWGGLDR